MSLTDLPKPGDHVERIRDAYGRISVPQPGVVAQVGRSSITIDHEKRLARGQGTHGRVSMAVGGKDIMSHDEFKRDYRPLAESKNPLANVDVDSIVKASIRKSPVIASVKEQLDESYVAEPKPYKQVSELVSQKTKDSHIELYKKYVETLNGVSAELDTADRSAADSRHSDFRSLKLDEAFNLNTVWLHELYFANCFDPHSQVTMDSKAYMRLERDFGTFEDWQKDFMACALSAGNGWVVCGYNMYLKRYVNTVISNHSQDVMLGMYPLVVVDMHEHSYYRDYLTDKRSYLVAQMREFNWAVVEERFLRAESLHEVMK